MIGVEIHSHLALGRKRLGCWGGKICQLMKDQIFHRLQPFRISISQDLDLHEEGRNIRGFFKSLIINTIPFVNGFCHLFSKNLSKSLIYFKNFVLLVYSFIKVFFQSIEVRRWVKQTTASTLDILFVVLIHVLFRKENNLRQGYHEFDRKE